MLASLGGLDALVFTDGISEDEPDVHSAACETFGFLGLELEAEKNARSPLDADVAAEGSRVRVLIVKSQENLADCAGVLGVAKGAVTSADWIARHRVPRWKV